MTTIHHIITADYSNCPVSSDDTENLRAISGITLGELVHANPDLLIFPGSLDFFDSNFDSNIICALTNDEKTLCTYSLVGFIGKNDTKLSIHSRFAASAGGSDYFLHYMLARVAGFSLLDLQHDMGLESSLDFLPFLFPLFLERAFAQGIYRKYISRKGNDSRIKGRIDIERHIRKNPVFCGNIAYAFRELSADNELNHLVRHTVAHISRLPYGKLLLESNRSTREAIKLLIESTPTWSPFEKQKIIAANLKQKFHPLLTAYSPLRDICIKILGYEKSRYAPSEDSIHGLLIDATWLWEEYLAVLLEGKFEHCHKESGPRFCLFESGQRIIPDFVRRIMAPTVVADAKYIPLNRRTEYYAEKATAIYYKTLAYMYCFRSPHAFLFYPISEDDTSSPAYERLKTRRYEPPSHPDEHTYTIVKLGLRIPANCISFPEFCSAIAKNEDEFLRACMQ